MGFLTAGGLVVTHSRAFVIDTLACPQDMAPVLAVLAERAAGRRRVVINTHHHWDHVYGNGAFPTGDIVAQRSCPRLLEAQLHRLSGSAPAPPPEGVRTPTITFGDRVAYLDRHETVHLIATPGHSEDSLIVYLDGARVLFAGDTLEWPFPTFAQRDGRDTWVRTLRQLKQLPADIIVPGHGPTMGKQLIDANERYITAVYETVAAAKRRGVERHELDVRPEEVLGSDVELDAVYREAHRANVEWAYDEV